MSNAQLAMAEKALQISKESSAQKLNVTSDFSRIILPCRMMVSGPTMSGKSEFILNLLRHRQTTFNAPFSRVIYCIPAKSSEHHYDFVQRMTSVYSQLSVIEGLPKIARDDLLEGDGQKLIILDDLIHDMLTSQEMREIFTIHSHHAKLSVSK